MAWVRAWQACFAVVKSAIRILRSRFCGPGSAFQVPRSRSLQCRFCNAGSAILNFFAAIPSEFPWWERRQASSSGVAWPLPLVSVPDTGGHETADRRIVSSCFYHVTDCQQFPGGSAGLKRHTLRAANKAACRKEQKRQTLSQRWKRCATRKRVFRRAVKLLLMGRSYRPAEAAPLRNKFKLSYSPNFRLTSD